MEFNRFKLKDENIILLTKIPLLEAIEKEFTEYKLDTVDGGYLYTFEPMPNMCFSLRALLAKYDKTFSAEEEVLRILAEQTKLATMPVLSLYPTGKHVQIQCPPLNYYLELVGSVGAASKGFNTYTVPIARAYDVIRAAETTPNFLPQFVITKDLRNEIAKPIKGFDGSIASLFGIPIEELHAASSAYRVKPENFKNIGYNSVADFLVKQPRRYIDKTNLTAYDNLEYREPVNLIGKIINKKLVYYKHATFDIQVGNRVFECTYYNRSWMIDKFNLGDEVLIMGEYSGKGKIAGQSLESLIEAQALDIVPIYPQSAKNKITSKLILNVVYEAIERIGPYVDKLTPYIDVEEVGMTFGDAIREMHFPSSSESYVEALEALALYELIYLQLMIINRKATETKDKGLQMPNKRGGYFDAMINSLPWELTQAQKDGLKQINGYMSSETAEQVLLSADVGAGKGLRENEVVATPSGWRKMKDLKVGDYVIGRNGKPTKVIGVYPQGEQELAKITFKDNVEIITDMEHRWTVIPTGQYPEKYPSGQVPEYVISTKDLLSEEKKPMKIPLRNADGSVKSVISRDIETHYKNSRGYSKWKIPLITNPVEYDVDYELPIDPYVLGYWLGDGGHSGLNISIGWYDVEDAYKTLSEAWDGTIDVMIEEDSGNAQFRLKKKGVFGTDILKKAGVFKNKHIPEVYMTASVEDRISLLHGLIDSDGSISKDGQVDFGNTNKRIVDGVVELVQSLGGISWHGKGTYKTYPYHGKLKRTKKASYSVVVNLPPGIQPCRLPRKLNRYNSFESIKKGSQKLTRSIRKVEKLDYKEKTICIKVDAEDENFVTKGYVVTHNTVLAQASCMQALDNGYQSVLAAPTEVLAIQLFNTFEKVVNNMPEDMRPTLAFLGGKMKAKEKREILKYVKTGDIDILVGTHSVLNDKIEFRNLGLVVIDEQQKFGTSQREALLDSRADGRKPDLLAQTATPIPRSTAQAFYGDINLISLYGKPKGRIEIETKWIKADPKIITKDEDYSMWKDIMKEIKKGHQAFVVVPMVYESKKMDSASVEGAYKDLKKILPEARIGYTHGSLKKDDRNTAMEEFRKGELDILVASTVIEVGVDVPNATRIVILSADRMGASSLHQVRGRVGRSNLPSTCYLVSEGKTPTSKKRLQALVDFTDGFEIAKVDLETRGQGDLFGLRQAGESTLRFSNLVDHSKLVGTAQRIANEIYGGEYKEIALADAQAFLGHEEEIIV